VNDSLATRARVGYVAEDVPLYGGMGVREFLTFMARLKGLERRAASGRWMLRWSAWPWVTSRVVSSAGFRAGTVSASLSPKPYWGILPF